MLCMDDAFLDLLGLKDFEYITVKEICERAGVNRSTFYLHYETIEDLLAESMQRVQEELEGCFEADPSRVAQRLASCPPEELELVTPEYLVPYLQFVRDRRRLFRVALDHPDSLRAERTYGRMYESIFQVILGRLGVPEHDRGYLMAFYVEGIMAIIERWLQADCADSVEHVVSVIQICVPRMKKDQGVGLR